MIDATKFPEVQAALSRHDLSFPAHDNLTYEDCKCANPNREHIEQARQAMGADGGTCFACGGMTVRTGSCTTCTNCATTSGCG